jgi:hypothetical protein
MNLEELKSRTIKVKKVTLKDGSEWHIRKLSATLGIAVGAAFKAAGHTDPNGPEPSQEQMLSAYSLLLSKTVCDEAGALGLDTDEGRAELKNMDYPTVQELAGEVQEWSIPDSAKKN